MKKSDTDKIKLLNQLIEQLKSSGIAVRREELKSGPGWRAVSGSCIVEGTNTVIVDRRMPIEEQLSIVFDAIKLNNLTFTAEMSEKIANHS